MLNGLLRKQRKGLNEAVEGGKVMAKTTEPILKSLAKKIYPNGLRIGEKPKAQVVRK